MVTLYIKKGKSVSIYLRCNEKKYSQEIIAKAIKVIPYLAKRYLIKKP